MVKRGDRYGKWTVVQAIDSGGQAAVYRATGAEGDPEVAIKIIKANRLKKRDRFLQEIGAQRKLTSQSAPNVMPLLDSNFDELQDGGVSGYLVMPLASLSLETVLGTIKGRPELALEIFAGILGGVGAAHDAGIVHRDLKPANILFVDVSLREPLIADFGICLLKETPDAKRLTDEGETVGAKYFMAPEQERGGVSMVSYAADIYALGKLLHHLLTGRNIYREETEQAFTEDELRNDSRYGDILDRIIRRTVLHNSTDRIQSISELKEIVQTLRAGKPLPREADKPPPAPAVAEPTPADSSEAVADYRQFMRTAGNAAVTADHLLALDEMRRDLQRSWQRIYEEIKDNPGNAPIAAEALITEQRRPLALALALGRSNSSGLFPGFKHFLEATVREDEPRSGYVNVFSVPYSLGGFLYMAAATQSLCHESWDVLRLLLNEKFEWYYRSGRPQYSFGFSVSYFFHSDALGREASKIHDLYRAVLKSTPLRAIMTLTDDDLQSKYLQVQLLMSLRVVQEIERGNEARIWPDYGRFYDSRVRPMFDRAWAIPRYGDGLSSVFGETRDEFFSKLNERLSFIPKHFWSGSSYFWESLAQWSAR